MEELITLTVQVGCPEGWNDRYADFIAAKIEKKLESVIEKTVRSVSKELTVTVST